VPVSGETSLKKKNSEHRVDVFSVALHERLGDRTSENYVTLEGREKFGNKVVTTCGRKRLHSVTVGVHCSVRIKKLKQEGFEICLRRWNKKKSRA